MQKRRQLVSDRFFHSLKDETKFDVSLSLVTSPRKTFARNVASCFIDLGNERTYLYYRVLLNTRLDTATLPTNFQVTFKAIDRFIRKMNLDSVTYFYLLGNRHIAHIIL